MNTEIIQKIENHIRKEMDALCAAHDFAHIQRVVENAKKIFKEEQKGDLLIIEAGALLHESFDEKFFEKGQMESKKEELTHFLTSLSLNDEQIARILFIVENVGYGKSLERTERFEGSIEFQIVEDADRLEAIGAIAIARTFTYGGKKGRPIHDPEILPVEIKTKEDYYTRSTESTSFNHFAEKLLLLKGMMHTNTGKQLAKQRHDFMQSYVDQFLAEWKGDL